MNTFGNTTRNMNGETHRSAVKLGCSIKSRIIVGTPVKRVTFSCSITSRAFPASHFRIITILDPEKQMKKKEKTKIYQTSCMRTVHSYGTNLQP